MRHGEVPSAEIQGSEGRLSTPFGKQSIQPPMSNLRLPFLFLIDYSPGSANHPHENRRTPPPRPSITTLNLCRISQSSACSPLSGMSIPKLISNRPCRSIPSFTKSYILLVLCS